ncbi:unannotated protein [freshwater metagenome]|uniref:Unannotated protein n=1 Tax=freshwater metagenome TaxID=449393 RepID=A0A6J6IS13_9ZZZZ
MFVTFLPFTVVVTFLVAKTGVFTVRVLSLSISGSFQTVISPLKIFAIVVGER